MNWCCQKEDGVSEFTGKKFWHWCGGESFLVKIALIFMSRESQKKVIKFFCSGLSGYFFFVMVERSLHMRSKQMITRKNYYVSSSFKKIYLIGCHASHVLTKKSPFFIIFCAVLYENKLNVPNWCLNQCI